MNENAKQKKANTQTRKKADAILQTSVELMAHEGGAPIPMIIDRLLTYALAMSVKIEGSKRTAQHMRLFAERIDSGLFEPEKSVPVENQRLDS